MDENTARELRQQTQPTPAAQPTVTAQPTVGRVPFSKFEILLGVVCTALVAWMVVSLISSKIALNNHQHTLQQVQNQIAKVNSSNTSIQQEIAEATSQANLQTQWC